MEENGPNVLFMSSYPPRGCGIATFTQDLYNASKKISNINFKIIAMDKQELDPHEYPEEVLFQVNEKEVGEYVKLAKKINKMDSVKVINIQHEFGLYGGKFLNYLTGFLETINKPVVITLHSISPDPPDNIKNIIQYLGMKCSLFIVMSKKGVEILKNDYGIDESKIVVIPHGIHEVNYEKSIIQKEKLGYKDKIILSSFGLIGGKKNYEVIIRALPEIIKDFPNVLFLIIGATHPGIFKSEGNKYLDSVQRLINEMNLNNHVKFINRYLELEELLQYLRATDISLFSGLGLTQITSGTLVYAMGCGRPVISHGFLHAQEAITPERGFLVELGNSEAYAKAIIKLLSDEELREKMGRNAYEYTRPMLWSNVAESYIKIFRKFLIPDYLS